MVAFVFHAIRMNFMENRNRNACFLRLVLLGFFHFDFVYSMCTPALFIVPIFTSIQRTSAMYRAGRCYVQCECVRR